MLSKIMKICLIMIAAVGFSGFFDQLQAHAEQVTFKDVKPGDGYYDEIMFLAKQGIVNGYSDGSFKPNANLTRREAATMVGRALGVDGTPRKTAFADVSAKDYASGYIQSLYEKNFITGRSDGLFHPDDKISRADMAYLITRAFSLQEMSQYLPFYDIVQDSPEYEPINKVTTARITNGFPDGSFKPGEKILRSHFALMVARAINPNFRPPAEAEKVISTGEMIASQVAQYGPSDNYHDVGTIPSGAQVKIYKKVAGWALVSTDTIKGYVKLKYVREPDELLKGKIIVLDPGHGGRDPGAIALDKTEEQYINYNFGVAAQSALQKAGAVVIMTHQRDKDCSPSKDTELQCRVNVAKANHADLFISIHSNWFSSEDAYGMQTHFNDYNDPYYPGVNDHPKESKILANVIQSTVPQAIGMHSRKVVDDNLYITRMNTVPAVLIELGFLTNPSDLARLEDPATATKFGNALVEALRQYFMSVQ